MKRIALDSNAVDCFVDTPGLLEAAQRAHTRGTLVFVVNHVMHDELAATEKPERRAHLLRAWETLPKAVVKTHGGVWGTTQWSGGTYGDGGESGVTLPQVRTKGRGAMKDALIATTASGEADVLVTGDGTLREKVRQSTSRCEVWSLEQLQDFIRTASDGPLGATV